MAEKSRQGINIRVCTKAPLLGEKAGPPTRQCGQEGGRGSWCLGDPTIGGKQVCYSAKEGPMSSRNLVIFLVRI